MGINNVVFLEILEWFDESGAEVAHRLPQEGSGELKFGAQVIVRESQAAVFYSSGVACDALGPGRHTLSTYNIPVLTKLLSLPWAFSSPFRAEVYFTNLKIFNNLRWGTRDPVAFRDRDLGLVRIRANGIFNLQVTQPVLFINSLIGTSPSYTIGDLEKYFNEIIISRLNDLMGEELDTLFDLPGRYDDFSKNLSTRLEQDFSEYGLALRGIYINSITPPGEVQQAIDDKGRLALLNANLGDFMQMKAAMAMEGAATSGNGAAGAGVGMGIGMLLPGMLTASQGIKQTELQLQTCPKCGTTTGAESKFCPSCGHQLLTIRKCRMCSADLHPASRFCHKCGAKVEQEKEPRICKECSMQNRPEAVFCNNCGAKL